jgi:hypothetical protein
VPTGIFESRDKEEALVPKSSIEKVNLCSCNTSKIFSKSPSSPEKSDSVSSKSILSKGILCNATIANLDFSHFCLRA